MLIIFNKHIYKIKTNRIFYIFFCRFGGNQNVFSRKDDFKHHDSIEVENTKTDLLEKVKVVDSNKVVDSSYLELN